MIRLVLPIYTKEYVMSLKAFHIAFITLSALLTFGLAVYAMTSVEGTMRFAWAALAVAGGILLVLYGIRFLKKMKHVGFF